MATALATRSAKIDIRRYPARMTPERCDGIVLAAGAGTRYGMPKALAENGAWLHTAVRALREGGCARVFVVLGATGPAHRLPTPDSEPAWLISQTPRIPLPPGARPVWAADWAVGVSASLRAGLAAAAAAQTLEAEPGIDATTATTHSMQDADPAVAQVRPGPADLADRLPNSEPDTGEQVIAARTTASSTTAERTTAAGNSGAGSTTLHDLPGYVAIMPVDTPDVGGAVVARVLAAARASGSGVARAVFAGQPGHPVLLGRAHWAGVIASTSGNSGAGTYLQGRADMVCVTCDDLATGIDRDYPCGTR